MKDDDERAFPRGTRYPADYVSKCLNFFSLKVVTVCFSLSLSLSLSLFGCVSHNV
jgi:hypothetical protein